MDLATLIRSGARQFASRPATVCDDRTLSYAELYERSCRLADALAGLGVAPGDRVATLADNSPESLELVLGIALGGYVRAALYPHNSPTTNRDLLERVGASALLVQPAHLEAIGPLLGSVPGLRHVICFDGAAPEGTARQRALDYEQLLAATSPIDAGLEPDPDAPQTIRFSAGTTGAPKGILHSVRAWTEVGRETRLVLPVLGPTDSYLAAGPLAHASAMPVPAVLEAGGTVVVQRAFDPAAVLAAIERHRITLSFGVPTMVQMLAEHPAAAATDLSSLRVFVYGGSPMTETTLARARAVFGDVLLQLYGQSEGAPLATLDPAAHLAEGGRWLRSAGRATPNTRLTIVGEDGTPLPTGEVGEIAAHTPTAFVGIWDDPKATAARMLPDGSLLTRDMGYLDEHGYLFLTDRKEDMIISGGFNIWPAELENALVAHPGVREAAVVGIPHDKWGETPMALVVPVEGASVTEAELVEWTRDKVGPVKRVTYVRFGSELPKTPVGKVVRRAVREQHAPAGHSDSTPNQRSETPR